MTDPLADSAPTSTSIKQALATDYEAIVDLYRQAQWNAPDSEGEFWVARRADDPIAVAKIVNAPEGYAFLDAIVVSQSSRRSGVGSRLLAEILTTRDTDWWLECRHQLIPFYTPHAFVVAQDEHVPEWVRERVGTRARPTTYLRRRSSDP